MEDHGVRARRQGTGADSGTRPPPGQGGARGAGRRAGGPLVRPHRGSGIRSAQHAELGLTVILDPELSRLAFEERLIEYCEDRAVPLLERVRLLGIAASRLDTFFMTRIGRLKRLAAVHSNAKQLDLVAAECHRVMDRAYRLLEDELIPSLEGVGVTIVPWSDLSAADRTDVQMQCAARLETMVRPLEVGPAAPFPHVRNLRPAVIAT